MGVNLNDPDIIFLLSGGFVYYDASGCVVGAMAISSQDTQYFVSFSEPEYFHQDDVLR